MNPNALPEYRCLFTEIAPEKLTIDPAAAPWRDSTPIHPFLRAEDGLPPRQSTTARAVWSRDALHVLFDCEDDHIWGNFQRHNDPIFDEEVVEVFLDPEGRRSRYWEFEISPRSVLFAAEIANDGATPPGVRILRHLPVDTLGGRAEVDGRIANPAAPDRRWRALLSIPFALIERPAPPRPGDVWRVNFFRIDRPPAPHPGEFTCWSPTFSNPAYFHYPAYFGSLIFAK